MSQLDFQGMTYNLIEDFISSYLGCLDREFPAVQDAIQDLKNEVIAKASKDLQAFSKRDPALANTKCVYAISSSFKAILSYRIANEIYYKLADKFYGFREELRRAAMLISEEAKISSQVEIHPAAIIGEEFVVDHGVGTVIGETAILGNRCYLLQGVVLGASGIADNKTGKRHPEVGDNVEISSFVKVLGNVKVGDNVFIGPRCIVTFDIPSNSRVTLATQLQIQRKDFSKRVEVYGVVPDGGVLNIYGFFPENTDAILLDDNYLFVDDTSMEYKIHNNRVMKIKIDKGLRPAIKEKGYFIGLLSNRQIVAVIRGAIGFKRYLEEGSSLEVL